MTPTPDNPAAALHARAAALAAELAAAESVVERLRAELDEATACGVAQGDLARQLARASAARDSLECACAEAAAEATISAHDAKGVM